MTDTPAWAGEKTWKAATNAALWAEDLYNEEITNSEKLEVTEAIAAAIIGGKVEVFEEVKREILMRLIAINGQYEVLDIKRESDTLETLLEAIDALYEKVN